MARAPSLTACALILWAVALMLVRAEGAIAPDIEDPRSHPHLKEYHKWRDELKVTMHEAAKQPCDKEAPLYLCRLFPSRF